MKFVLLLGFHFNYNIVETVYIFTKYESEDNRTFFMRNFGIGHFDAIHFSQNVKCKRI